MKKTYHLGATAAFGLEGVVANELKRMGFDAKGFLVNHYDRDIPEAEISQSCARESVSPRLEIVSGRLALIPTDGLEEKLCYEFRCRAENGRNVLVYINAQTAEEEQILILVESKSGTLTV